MDILLIDDETRPMSGVVELLRENNYVVEQISSATRALQMLQKNPTLCKLIVLDMMMPAEGEFDPEECEGGVRTGIVLLEKLRKIPEAQNIPVLAFTAYSKLQEALRGKVGKFLLKPARYDKIEAAIKELLEERNHQSNGDSHGTASIQT